MLLRILIHVVFGMTPALCGILYGIVAPFTEPSDFALLNLLIAPIGVAWWRLSYKVLRVG